MLPSVALLLSFTSYAQDSTAVASSSGGALSRESLLGIIAVLSILIIGLLAVINKYVKSRLDEKIATGEVNEEQLQTIDINPTKKIHPGLLVLGGLGLLSVILVAGTVEGVQKIGSQEGYAPNQPINFSHKIHAGQYNIQCSYCHTGVERNKNATIPAANICMNCHNSVKTESPEIAKIYNAVGWDPAKKEYIADYKQKPIEWVRIHNLQDFAYFNHSQHYKVAGVECQTCHGQVQEMEKVEQHSKLTMGWCIDCHTTTKVKLDNEYYKTVHGKTEKYQHAVKNGHGLTISQLGGMECSKCHY